VANVVLLYYYFWHMKICMQQSSDRITLFILSQIMRPHKNGLILQKVNRINTRDGRGGVLPLIFQWSLAEGD